MPVMGITARFRMGVLRIAEERRTDKNNVELKWADPPRVECM